MANIDIGKDTLTSNANNVNSTDSQSNKLSEAEECFRRIKESQMNASDEMLDEVYNTCLALLAKYKKTGQVRAIRKLLYHVKCIDREREVVRAGVTKFVYRSDIEDYIDNVSKDDVKIIELKNYERDIPNEIVEVVERVGKYFDNLYVLFTDYTGKVERQIKKEERTKDPILFGVFRNNETRTVIERFYYLGDWEDEYCSLTLDKMVGEMNEADRHKIVHSCELPSDIEELKIQLENMVQANDKEDAEFAIVDRRTYEKGKNQKHKKFFNNIRTIFSKGKK